MSYGTSGKTAFTCADVHKGIEGRAHVVPDVPVLMLLSGLHVQLRCIDGSF